MPRFLFNVPDAFGIKGRGVCVCCDESDLLPIGSVCAGRTIEFRRGSTAVLRTSILEIAAIHADPPTLGRFPVGIVLSADIPTEAIRGTQAWLIHEADS